MNVNEASQSQRLVWTPDSFVLDNLDKSLTQWFKEKWVDISRPKEGGGFEPCGRADADSGKYPKCVPQSKASSMTAEEIRSAVQRKRKAESTQDREGKKPINVPTILSKESVNVPTNPELYARVKSEAKQKFDVYPSAYANAWLVREYKSRGGKYRIEKAETPAWQREEGKNPKGGLNAAGRASYNRETGGNLKPPVRSGDNPRRASFLARMGNNAGPERDENGEPTRLLLSLQAWGADSKADARAKAKAISARNANKVDKGDFVGHPFRGNQWGDASGAASDGSFEGKAPTQPRKLTIRQKKILDGVLDSGTPDFAKTVHEIALGYDESGSILDNMPKLNSATDSDAIAVSEAISADAKQTLSRRGFGEEFSVWRTAGAREKGVVSVTTREGGIQTFSQSENKITTEYRVRRDDVLTDAEGLLGNRQTYSEDELHVDFKNLSPVTVEKGDFVGHPFRGNQWADSSGASTIGASGDQDPSVSANGLQIVADRTARTIAETINDKTSNLASDGDARVESFIGSEDSFDTETSKLLQRELDDLSKSVFGAHPQTGMVQRDIGFDMVEGAFWEAHDDDTDLIILRDKSDRIAGAVSFEHEAGNSEEDFNEDLIEMGHLGTTGLVDGAGSTLLGMVIKHAATINSGIALSPLNKKAAEYWSQMGFESTTNEETGEGLMIMSPESVAKINEELDL